MGKTHIISNFVNGFIPNDIRATLGIDFLSKVVRDPSSGMPIKMMIFDTAGEEKYHAVTANHYRKAKGCFIVYDVTNRQSFENVDKWLTNVRQLGDPECVIIVLGNKCDIDSVSHNTDMSNESSFRSAKKSLLREVTLDEGL